MTDTNTSPSQIPVAPGINHPGVRLLVPGEEALLAELEQAAWPLSLQASAEVIHERVRLGHTFLVMPGEQGLIASACYVYTHENPLDASNFPKTFAKYSSLPCSEPIVSLYVYNLCVHPAYRGQPVVRSLIDAVVGDACRVGANYLVGDGRCPSYNGTNGSAAEKVHCNPRFRQIIEQWHASGEKPPDAELIGDPLLRFYYRVLGCRFLHLMPDFIPEDVASGGYRVIFTKILDAGSGYAR
jgi:hypothetical protein